MEFCSAAAICRMKMHYNRCKRSFDLVTLAIYKNDELLLLIAVDAKFTNKIPDISIFTT